MIEAERVLIDDHLRDCEPCADVMNDYRHTRQSLRAMPTPPLPPRLSMNLRVIASREAARRRRYAGPWGWARYCSDRVNTFFNEMMRPIAIPFAGGLASAVVLFSAILTNFTGVRAMPLPDDVPISIVTTASVKNVPVDFLAEEVVVDVLVDTSGRLIDYSFPEGYGSLSSSALRRQLEHSLLFTEFTPATTFGQPTAGWVRVSFRRSAGWIDVQG